MTIRSGTAAPGEPADAAEHSQRVVLNVVADLARRAIVPRPRHGIVRLQIRATQQPGSSTSSLSTSRVVSVTDVGVSVGGMGLCVVRGSAIMVFWRGLRRGALHLLSLESRAREPRARGNLVTVFFCLCSPWEFRGLREQFAAVSRKQYDQSVRLCRKPRYWTASSAAQGGPAPGNPFYEGVETYLFATTPLRTKQKIMCRPGRRWGWGPRFDAPGAGRTVRGRSAATRFFGAYCIT